MTNNREDITALIDFSFDIAKKGIKFGFKWGTIALLGMFYMKGCVLKDVDTSIRSLQPQLKKSDVLSGTGKEEFYEIDGKKAYVKIDGYSLENLYNKR